jgi:hypothetical protein
MAIRLIADVVVANQQRLVKQHGLALNPGMKVRGGDVTIFLAYRVDWRNQLI